MRSLIQFCLIFFILLTVLASCSHDGLTEDSAYRAKMSRTHFGSPEKQAPATSPKNIVENPWIKTTEDTLSTFSIDVDTASFSYARSQIVRGYLPSPEFVRTEEFINYFAYDYQEPTDDEVFSVDMDVHVSPLDEKKHILRVGIQGAKMVNPAKHKNLVFLVDVSGSMSSEDKLNLVQSSLKLLVKSLKEGDYVALVTYAGSTEVILPSTAINEKNRGEVIKAIDNLFSGGGTHMSDGMKMAYQEAMKRKGPKTDSRVIVCSDGDANIGSTDHQTMLEEIKGYVKQGVGMTTLGFGQGVYNDYLMEQLANNGDGNYYYIDSIKEAEKVLLKKMNSTLVTIAKDVKLQMDFSQERVKTFRLIGYENRVMEHQDFENDQKDAGEVGSGHQITALYEMVLAPKGEGKLAELKMRYKMPKEDTSVEKSFEANFDEEKAGLEEADSSYKFAVGVALFALKMRKSQSVQKMSYKDISKMIEANAGDDQEKKELVKLISQANEIK